MIYTVERDTSGDVALWEYAHDDARFPFGPVPILYKSTTPPVVWNATCRVLIGGRS